MIRITGQIILLVLLSGSFFTISAQVPKYNPYFVGESTDSVDVNIFRLNELGSQYYDEVWNAGNIYLVSGDTLRGYYMRYDILRNSLEIIVDKAFQSVNKSQVAGFDWFSAERLKVERFTNRNLLDFETDKLLTFFPEIIEEGPVTLLKVKELVSRRNANSPLLINNETEKVVVMDKLYYYRDNDLQEVHGSRGRNLDYFDSEKLEAYVKEQNFNFSNEGDVKRAVDYFNTECTTSQQKNGSLQ